MNYQKALNNPIFQVVSTAAEELGGVSAYVIGGFVRDFLLKRGTPKDIDIVAVGSGIELAKAVAGKLKGKPQVSIFKNFWYGHAQT